MKNDSTWRMGSRYKYSGPMSAGKHHPLLCFSPGSTWRGDGRSSYQLIIVTPYFSLENSTA